MAEIADLYRFGLKDRENSLELYEKFMSNIEPGFSLEKIVVDLTKKRKCVRVFEIGCGNGGALRDIRKKFGNSVYAEALDLVPADFEAVDRMIIGNALDEPFPQGSDLIISFRTLHEAGNAEKIVQKVVDSLAKGGMAILSFRIMEMTPQGSKYHGKITDNDVKFLKKISEDGKFASAKVDGRLVYFTSEGIFIEKNSKTPKKGELSYLAGITLLVGK